MEQQSRRERKKEETRRRLLEAAFGLFVKNGFENTTIDQITEEADIGKGTFYNYFPTKEALLTDFFDELSVQRGEKIWAGILSLPDTRQRLKRAFESVNSWFAEYPEMLRVYWTERVAAAVKNPGEMKPAHYELYLAEILKLGQQAGDIRGDIDALQLSLYLNGILLMQFCQWFQQGTADDMQKLTMEGVDFFLVGALSTEKQ